MYIFSVVAQPRRIWVAGEKFGIEYCVTDICVQARPAAARQRPFAHDDTVQLLAVLAAFK